MALTNQILNLNSENDRILRHVSEIWNLISPQMDTMLSNKVDFLKTMEQVVPSELKDVEIYAYVFNAFIIVLDNLKNGWDTYLGFLKTIFVDIFKYVYIIWYIPLYISFV